MHSLALEGHGVGIVLGSDRFGAPNSSADHAIRVQRVTQFVSQVWPWSGENACSHCLSVGERDENMPRTLIGPPSKVSSERNVPPPLSNRPSPGASDPGGILPVEIPVRPGVGLRIVGAQAEAASGGACACARA